MLKVYICEKCGRYRFVTNHNYKCDKPMKLSNIEYEKYITLDAISRQKIIEGYMIHS